MSTVACTSIAALALRPAGKRVLRLVGRPSFPSFGSRRLLHASPACLMRPSQRTDSLHTFLFGRPNVQPAQADSKEELPAVPTVPLRIKYYFDEEIHTKVINTSVPADETQRISVQRIAEELVKDSVNLRRVKAIRYMCEHEDGYVRSPFTQKATVPINIEKLADGKQMNVVRILLQRSKTLSNVLGPSLSFDPNMGFIFSHLNPDLTFRYQAVGKLNSRTYQAELATIGVKADISLRFLASFVWKPPFKEIHSFTDPIPLGRGVDIGLGTFMITYVSFKNSSGGLFMIGFNIGINAGIAVVTEGWLVPKR